MGCVGLGRKTKKAEGCQYWVHSVCWGYQDATEDEIQNINFYCHEHNPRAAAMKKSKQQADMAKKSEEDDDKHILMILHVSMFNLLYFFSVDTKYYIARNYT